MGARGVGGIPGCSGHRRFEHSLLRSAFHTCQTDGIAGSDATSGVGGTGARVHERGTEEST